MPTLLKSQVVKTLDDFCDRHKIAWHEGGQELRRLVDSAVIEAYWEGRKYERMLTIQETCKHNFMFNSTGGVCPKCGATTLQCSSD